MWQSHKGHVGWESPVEIIYHSSSVGHNSSYPFPMQNSLSYLWGPSFFGIGWKSRVLPSELFHIPAMLLGYRYLGGAPCSGDLWGQAPSSHSTQWWEGQNDCGRHSCSERARRRSHSRHWSVCFQSHLARYSRGMSFPWVGPISASWKHIFPVNPRVLLNPVLIVVFVLFFTLRLRSVVYGTVLSQ